ncbi:MAG: hypothetical protein WCX73_03665 [Candidatus Pacearchaeota archaeon]|jgi:hypothetical protein
MKIIGFNLTKMSAERKEKSEKELRISQNIDITEIIKEKVHISEEEALKTHFSFVVDYSGDFAKIEFNGFVLLLPEKEELKQTLKNWKDKKLTDEFKVPLFNFIMNKCNIKALNLEDELSLPPHIQMPKISPKKQE